MDEDFQKQILDTLRNQTVLAKTYNKIWLVIICVFIILAISIPLVSHKIIRSNTCPQPVDSWQEVRNLRDRQDIDKAKEMVQRLIKNHPSYYWGYLELGYLYLELGNEKEAEENFARAYNLFPTKENEEKLDAVRKVIEKKKEAANK